ncbi:uncharacterized protein BX663DRAFT_511389 [Cokeromyces recurvatus]|uniref:uncharacterized protein n=1 Tax=Cokeromyces recurvatus TaxID=90255 RepID=UPI00221E84ED|nr:uncharacterized protein BX663DRAFT_511389 [Cokeromyces recurvatus]KAI7902535.1 hypothetical protein BX663DRAFT_511389 [Cokeromyces recurvatus]
MSFNLESNEELLTNRKQHLNNLKDRLAKYKLKNELIVMFYMNHEINVYIFFFCRHKKNEKKRKKKKQRKERGLKRKKLKRKS